MKITKYIVASCFIFSFMACKKDEATPTSVEEVPEFTLTDFSRTMMEKPDDNTEIGTVEVSSDATLDYSYMIESQSPEDAMKIDELTGELQVADGSKFEFNTSPTLTAVVQVTSGVTVQTLNVKLTLRTERDVLVDMYKMNPNNSFSWDTSSTDISTWSGVTVTDGYVTRMVIYKKNITSIPKELGEFRHLSDLAFTDNPLTSVPAELGQLVNLTKLSLLGGELTSVPKELSQLQKLETLSLNNNKLTGLPKELSQLTNLKQLFVRINNLTSVPKELALLTNLEQLDLVNNKLTSLPDEICNAFSFDGVTFQKDDEAKCANDIE